MWSPEKSQGYEVRKVRDRVASYLRGVILDVGCGPEKVCVEAIGIDYMSKAANIQCDLTHPESLRLFGSNSADVVFSSHFLEDCIDYVGMLHEFFRICKPGGHIILYLPHKDLYPNVGQEGANQNHKHDFIPSDIIDAMPGVFLVKRSVVHDENDEYSFELIVEKVSDLAPMRLPYSIKEYGRANTVVVVRYGGFGDMVIAAPIFKRLKEQGKYVIANVSADSKFVLDGNPYIDEFLIQSRYTIPSTQLKEYFEVLSQQYGQVINLCESMERTLLVEREKDPDLFYLPHEERHKRFNRNYSEATMELAGLSGGAKPELYLTQTEEVLCNVFKQKHRGFFNVMFQVSGSSWHKLYPHASDVVDDLLDEFKDMQVFLTGGSNASLLNWTRPRLHNRIGQWDMRQTMVLTKFMDCVISPETGTLNAAGAFDTPKIGLLTHSSKENLTKYFTNDYSIQSDAPCSPCHRMIHELHECPLDDVFGLPVCMSKFMDPEKIKNAVREIYRKRS